MSIITRDEVKSILRITENWVDKEAVTMDTVNYKRLANKGSVIIYRVDTDTSYSTASAYTTNDYYTTSDFQDYCLIRRIDTGAIADTEKVYVSYSYDGYDDLIDDLIPIVQADLVSYLNNDFADKQTRYQSGSFRFKARAGSSHPQITDTVNARFLYYGFEDSMDISVKNTSRNSGIYRISDVSSNVCKLTVNDTLTKEYSTDAYHGWNVTIDRINWPIDLKPVVSYLIWNAIDKNKNRDIKSRSLGPSSITYETLDSGGYPPSIYNALKKYKNVRMK